MVHFAMGVKHYIGEKILLVTHSLHDSHRYISLHFTISIPDYFEANMSADTIRYFPFVVLSRVHNPNLPDLTLTLYSPSFHSNFSVSISPRSPGLRSLHEIHSFTLAPPIISAPVPFPKDPHTQSLSTPATLFCTYPLFHIHLDMIYQPRPNLSRFSFDLSSICTAYFKPTLSPPDEKIGYMVCTWCA
ncbi:hypothetical protein BCR34DRAFT_176767 [Clohesyomyces aquaticus]|uniref:Uncharacterized protein n=1 Tax=Clohesyomyces aquaticus TaxID=1231657 RepID=A0A1Y1YFG7_9PLEO|nr:hypothetical protein BCR34DRAFT_176767 [Clohesyomyces aquaticus]